MNSGRGYHSLLLFMDLGLALAPKMCPDQSQTFKEVNNSQAFTIGRKKNSLFCERAASRCSKACFYKVSRKYSKNRLRRTNNKSSLSPKIDFTLKPSNDAKPWFLHFTAQTSKCPRRFGEIRPWNFEHEFNVPLPSLLRMFLFLFFSLEMWDPLKPNYPKKKHKPKYLAGQKETHS